MSAMHVYLAVNSVCPCGFPLQLPVVFVHEKDWPWGKSKAGWLPAQVFKPIDE